MNICEENTKTGNIFNDLDHVTTKRRFFFFMNMHIFMVREGEERIYRFSDERFMSCI